MAEFNFQGADTQTNGGPNYGLETSHVNTTVTENNISFTFNSEGPAEFPGQSVADHAFHLLGSDATDNQVTATLMVVDTDFQETFLKSVTIQVSSYGSGGPMTIILSNTVLGTTSRFTLPATPLTGATFPSFTSNVAPLVADPNKQFNKFIFIANTGFITIDHITGVPNCFAAGTMIAAEHGEVAVEDLKAGDLVRTADGRLTPVTWLGTQEIDTRLMHPAKVNPICITAGALGGGLPLRDLHVSADHAIEIDGTLYNAGVLVNGETIYQKARMPKEGFTYYHVETGAHELLLAEGVAAESFIDYAGRDSFDNAPDGDGRVIPEMALPRVSTARLVPAELKTRLQEIAGQARVAA